jgi:hypothetical protein
MDSQIGRDKLASVPIAFSEDREAARKEDDDTHYERYPGRVDYMKNKKTHISIGCTWRLLGAPKQERGVQTCPVVAPRQLGDGNVLDLHGLPEADVVEQDGNP